MKCPHCKTAISAVNLDSIEMIRDSGAQKSMRGFAYSCPECQAILCVQMNTLTLQADLLDEIEKRIG